MGDSQVNTIGVISDVHGNLAALEQVFADMPELDVVVNAGDLVGYGPWPAECVTRVQHQQCYSVMGNHDQAVFDYKYFHESDKYAAETLDTDQREWLRKLPDHQLLFNGRIRIVHGHPENRFDYTTESEFNETLLNGESILVLGHTHIQAVKRVNPNQLVVNPGSVGQPRDEDPRAAYAVINLDELTVSLERVPYDIDRYVERLKETPIPQKTARRLYEGL